MKKTTWIKHHKWLGLLFSFFLLSFCLSGIILNHRTLFSSVDIGRNWLPSGYHFSGWNGGLMRGTVPASDADSLGKVLVYGTGGVWKINRDGSGAEDFNRGFPKGADSRQIRAIVRTSDDDLFAVSIFGLYRFDRNRNLWKQVSLPTEDGEMLTDATARGDSLIVAGRSALYVARPPYGSFKRLVLKQPAGYEDRVSLFRTVWMLHTGAIFGLVGRIIADLVAFLLIFLCMTGIIFWLLPKYIRRRKKAGFDVARAASVSRMTLGWHDRVGRYSIILTLFIAITGWCLRPPALIPLALTKVPPVLGSKLVDRNPWHDKIRMVRYDETSGDWMLSTSEGFYSLPGLEGVPQKIDRTPPVSVMGLNVFQKEETGEWLCGSFSGLYLWDRTTGRTKDYFTHEEVEEVAGPPFGKRAVSGYSRDFDCGAFPVEYYDGTSAVPQPYSLAKLPMSLWNVALEVHTGRLFIGAIATYIFVFVTGMAIVWILWSGWKLRLRRKKKGWEKG